MVKVIITLCFLLFPGIAQPGNLSGQKSIAANQVNAHDSVSLNAAITAIGSATKTLVISQPLPALTGNVTVPPTLTLEFTGAGQISCGSYVVTIQSSTSDWPSRQIFASDCSSTGSVDLSASTGHLRGLPQWFGGFPDDSADDITAINALANAVGVGSRVYFSDGAWDVSSAILFQNYQVFECAAPGGEPLNTGTLIRTTSGGTKTIFAAKTAGSAQTIHPSFLNCGLQVTSSGHIGLDLSRVVDAEVRNNKFRGSNTGATGVLIDSNPSSGLGNRIVNNEFYALDKGIVIRQDANANLIQSNKILSNLTYGISIQGTCSGGTCTSTNSCESTADCSGCSGTACSANVSGQSIGNRILSNWIEGNGSNNILDFGKATIISENYLEMTSAATTNLNLWGAGTLVGNNFFQQTTGKKSILINGVSGANGFRINIEDNSFRGAGTAIEESTAGVSITVGHNTYESVTAKLVTASSTGVKWVEWAGITASELPANGVANGSLLYVSDYAHLSNPCTTTSGNGAFMKRLNGVSRCD